MYIFREDICGDIRYRNIHGVSFFVIFKLINIIIDNMAEMGNHCRDGAYSTK